MTIIAKKLMGGGKTLNYLLASVIALAASVAWAANAVERYTDANGVTWTYELNTDTVADGSTAVTFHNEDDTPCIPTDIRIDAETIPWTFTKDGTDYTVTKVGNGAFGGGSQLYGRLTVPDSVNKIFAYGFADNCDFTLVTLGKGMTYGYGSMMYGAKMKALLMTGALGNSSGSPLGNTGVKTIIFTNTGFNNDLHGSYFFGGVSGATAFAPRCEKTYAGTKNTVYYYGPNEPFDMAFDLKAGKVTVTPTTEEYLVKAIEWAKTFKSDFFLDTTINITNSIGASVSVTAEQLQNVTFQTPPWFLRFAVDSQAQLDNILAAVSTDTPIIVELTKLDTSITVPEGREVAILAKSNMTFDRKRYGLVISLR